MASLFDKYDAKSDPTPDAPKTGGLFDKYEASDTHLPTDPHSWGRKANDPWYEKAGRFVTDAAATFDDAATFGLWPKALDAINNTMAGHDTGSQFQQNVDDITRENPGASVIGNLAGYAVPGMGIDSALSKMPRLAGNTYKALALRGMADGGSLKVLDDVVRGKPADPIGVAEQTAAGGVLGPVIHGVLKYVRPVDRIRAMGTNLTEAAKKAATDFAGNAADRGIALTGPEALQATSPGLSQDVRAHYDSAVTSPKGSVEAATFDANRTPGVKAAGQNLVKDLGGGVDPVTAMDWARGAVETQKKNVISAAKPLYDAAAPKKLPPTWVPRTPAVKQALDATTGDPIVMAGLARENGGMPVAPNSIAALDATKKELGGMFADNAEKRPGKAKFIGEEERNLTNVMDKVSPDYAQARATSEAGRAETNRLEAGPLGILAKSPRSATQGDALFGVTTGPDAQNSIEALNRVVGENAGAGRGILANRIDDAVSKDPLHFGNTALPNDHAIDVAKVAAGNLYDKVEPTLAASRAVAPARAPVSAQRGGGPWGAGWDLLTNYGQGDTVKLLNQPKNIHMMGVESPTQFGLRIGSTSIGKTIDKRRKPSKIN